MSIGHIIINSASANGFLALASFQETCNEAAVALSCANVVLHIVKTECLYDVIILAISFCEGQIFLGSLHSNSMNRVKAVSAGQTFGSCGPDLARGPLIGVG